MPSREYQESTIIKIIRWVKATAERLPDAPFVEEIPQRTCPHLITEIDELQTFVAKKN